MEDRGRAVQRQRLQAGLVLGDRGLVVVVPQMLGGILGNLHRSTEPVVGDQLIHEVLGRVGDPQDREGREVVLDRGQGREGTVLVGVGQQVLVDHLRVGGHEPVRLDPPLDGDRQILVQDQGGDKALLVVVGDQTRPPRSRSVMPRLPHRMKRSSTSRTFRTSGR